jgi:hypothetical protein
VVPGAGSAVVSNNMISGTPRGAVVGLEHLKAITNDLTQEARPRYAQLMVTGNAVGR